MIFAETLDPYLDRLVALKIFPPETVANPDRRPRREQEARTASAPNHPNVFHIVYV